MNKKLHTLVCLVVMLMAWGSAMANIVNETTCGTCKWYITDGGQLVIAPTNGSSGTMYEWKEENEGPNVPWASYRSKITSVLVKSGVAFKTCSYLFYNCSSMTSVKFEDAKTATTGVTNMNSMFCQCGKLASIDLTGFDTSAVTTMTSMFNGCHGLTSINVSMFDTQKVKYMSGMFRACNNLTELDLSNFVTPKLDNMEGFFYNCNLLTKLDIRNFVFDNCYHTENCMHLDDYDSMTPESQIMTIYLPKAEKDRAKSQINNFLASRNRSTDPCICYCPQGYKKNYSDFSVFTALGTNYPYDIDQYVLAGDISDGYTYVNPDVENNGGWQFGVGDLRYFRKIKNNWGTIILPWKINPSCTDYAVSYTLCNPSRIADHLEKNGETVPSVTALVKPATADIAENKPYVFYTAADVSYSKPVDIVFTNLYALTYTVRELPYRTMAVNQSTKDENLGLMGSYGAGYSTTNPNARNDYKFNTTENPGDYYYYYQANQFWHATSWLTVPCFRAYFDIPSDCVAASMGTTAAAKMNIAFDYDEEDIIDGSVTGIESVSAEETQSTAYNLAGQRVNAAAKGFVIRNGKKYVNR